MNKAKTLAERTRAVRVCIGDKQANVLLDEGWYLRDLAWSDEVKNYVFCLIWLEPEDEENKP